MNQKTRERGFRVDFRQRVRVVSNQLGHFEPCDRWSIELAASRRACGRVPKRERFPGVRSWRPSARYTRVLDMKADLKVGLYICRFRMCRRTGAGRECATERVPSLSTDIRAASSARAPAAPSADNRQRIADVSSQVPFAERRHFDCSSDLLRTTGFSLPRPPSLHARPGAAPGRPCRSIQPQQ
jgi:hypothetical protein